MIWAIGDIQGCYDSLMNLLKKIDFNPDRDTLWIAGDLVNRGAKSLEVLAYLYSIRKSLRVVLGNHDIALLAVWWGIKKSNPSLDPIFADLRAKEYLEWLRSLPFIHIDSSLGYVMSHAGISPTFALSSTLHYNRILTTKLQSQDAPKWLADMMSKSEDHFDPLGDDTQHERYMLACFTRMRYCYSDGKLDFFQKGAPSQKIKDMGLFPWFECPSRKKIDMKILFGHWSSLGYYENDEVCCLDSGCLWKRKLSARRLDGKGEELVQVDCLDGIEQR